MHEDLFAQAEILAKLDPRKPKQANLRRAISSAYYGIFHFFVDEACRLQFGTQHAQAAYRHTLGRAFTHSVMKQACISFGGGTLKASVMKGLPHDDSGNYLIPEAIQDAASTFVELQEKRSVADYDRTERFKRSDVLIMIDQAKSDCANFAELCAKTLVIARRYVLTS